MIHVVDAAGTEGRDPIDDIYKINAELEAYNPEIATRPQVIAANKTDLILRLMKIRTERLKKNLSRRASKFSYFGSYGKRYLRTALLCQRSVRNDGFARLLFLSRNTSLKTNLSTRNFRIL